MVNCDIILIMTGEFFLLHKHWYNFYFYCL